MDKTKGRNVDITIVSRQGDPEQEGWLIEKTAAGKLFVDHATATLAYREEDGLTTLTVKDNQVLMRRQGENRLRLEFISGQTTAARLRTSYGDISLDCFTRQIRHQMRAEEGRLELDYVLSQPGGTAPETKFSLAYRIQNL